VSSDEPNDRPPASKPGASKPAARDLRPGLYLVGTPIGNLGDITRRAIAVLSGVDIIAAEDTRVARRLLSALGLPAPRLIRYDDHADDAVRDRLIEAVQQGKTVALVSDAGMPLVADPGLRLVRAAQASGITVTAVPGPSAALTALALSGLPSDRFLFAGFLPAKDGPRRRALAELASVPATLVLFESPQRLVASLAAMADILGSRDAAVTRELTKLFEEVRRAPLAELAAFYAAAETPRGEIAVVIGPPGDAEAREDDLDARLTTALATMSLRDAATAVAAATGRKRGEVYTRALALQNGAPAKSGEK
jgi:16S rRNA (cytidine1402-2'-O)-methyltransferase